MHIVLNKPAPDVCQQCGIDHDEKTPHDNHTLQYQFWFHRRFGRWPAWSDAIAHCDEQTKQFWTEELKRLNVWTEHKATTKETNE